MFVRFFFVFFCILCVFFFSYVFCIADSARPSIINPTTGALEMQNMEKRENSIAEESEPSKSVPITSNIAGPQMTTETKKKDSISAAHGQSLEDIALTPAVPRQTTQKKEHIGDESKTEETGGAGGVAGAGDGGVATTGKVYESESIQPKRHASFLEGFEAAEKDDLIGKYHKSYVDMNQRSMFLLHVWTQILKRYHNAKR